MDSGSLPARDYFGTKKIRQPLNLTLFALAFWGENGAAAGGFFRELVGSSCANS